MPNARWNKLLEENGRLKVYLTAPAVEGKANAKLIDFLAEYYGVRKSKISIVRGLKNRLKVVEIAYG
jgi:uncharacterized protein (TIGR00251 family)